MRNTLLGTLHVAANVPTGFTLLILGRATSNSTVFLSHLLQNWTCSFIH